MRVGAVGVGLLLSVAALPAHAVAQQVVSIQVEAHDGVILSGDLHVPDGAAAAGVVLLGVAGPNDRNLRLGELTPFAAIATGLRAAGVAVLTFDDRGVGESGGDWSRAGYEVLAGDALAAAAVLAHRTGLDSTRIGLLGLSEGSAIAMLAAARAPGRVAFLVLGSPPGLPGVEALRAQLDAGLAAAGIGSDGARYHAQLDRFVTLARAAAADSAAFEELTAFLAGPGAMLIPPYGFIPRDPRARAALFSGPWYRSMLDYAPAGFLEDVRAPVLVVGGALDPILPPRLHHPPIAAMIGSDDVRLEVVPGVNHLLLPATTGLPAEYATITDSADDRVLALITRWLAARGYAHDPS